MKNQLTLSDFAVFLLSVGFLAWESQLSNYFPDQQLFRLSPEVVHWKFVPQHQKDPDKVVDPVSVNMPLSNFSNAIQPCCAGTYVGTAPKLPAFLDPQASQGMGLFLSSVAGFAGLKINGHPVSMTLDRSYANLGPIIVLPTKLFLAKKNDPSFKIEVAIQGGPRGGYTGFFREAPVMGPMLALSDFRDARVAYIKDLPLAFALIYVALAGVFIWLYTRMDLKEKLYQEFIWSLMAAALYHLFISGVVRAHASDWSMIIHFPSQIIIFGLVFRLLATFANLPTRQIQMATGIYLSAALLSYLASFLDLLTPVYLLNVLGRLMLAYPLFHFARMQRNAMQNTVFLTALPVFVFFLSDGVQLLSRVLHFSYPIGFRDRQISPFILLSSLVYLVHQISESVLLKFKKTAWDEVTAQVVHDLRSPLAALKGISGGLEQLPETERLILRTVTNRIQDITNLLVAPSDFSIAQPGSTELSTCLISDLIENVVAEKRFQFRSSVGIQIDTDFDSSSYGLFAQIQPRELKRALSNLINNAVEAAPKNSQISILLSHAHAQVQIRIHDQGAGIPKQILKKLGERGVTHGKPEGQGLGIWHARTSVQQWGGTLQIDSKIGEGTQLTLSIPTQTCPPWFVEKIELKSSAWVFILDDDASIHQIWDKRLEPYLKTHAQMQIYHSSNLEDVTALLNSQPNLRSSLFLCDYEFSQSKQNGLEWLCQNTDRQQAILITSYAEDPQLILTCEQSNIRMIPKTLVGIVPFEFSTGDSIPHNQSPQDSHHPSQLLNV